MCFLEPPAFRRGEVQLDDSALFSDLQAACLMNRRETMFFSGDRAGLGWKFEVADDPRIIAALWERRDVAGLKPVRGLRIVSRLEQGRVIFEDETGHIWLGANASHVSVSDWNAAHTDWPVAVIDNEIFIVVRREEWFSGLLGQLQHEVFWIGSIGHPIDTQSQVAVVAKVYGQQAWLKDWLSRKMAGEAKLPDQWPGNPYAAHSYRHPGDPVLSHFGHIDGQRIARAKDLAEIMGWSAADLLALKSNIEAQKASAAEVRREADRTIAGQLARPKLEAMDKTALFKLAEQTGLTAKKSAAKPILVDALATHQPAAEKVIGL